MIKTVAVAEGTEKRSKITKMMKKKKEIFMSVCVGRRVGWMVGWLVGGKDKKCVHNFVQIPW